MTRVSVKVLHSYLKPPTTVKGWRVDEYLAAVKWDGVWQVAHIETGLITRWHTPLTLVDVIQFAQAATRRFGKRVLAISDDQLLIAALRKAGSDKWSKRRWAQIRKKPA